MNKFDFPIDVIKSNRQKSASIQVENGLVKVRVPKFLSEERIDQLIVKRVPWIQSKLKEYSHRSQFPSKKYVDGEIFSYFGKNYPLKIIEGDKVSIKLKNGCFKVIIPKEETNKSEKIQDLIKAWYQRHAEKHLVEKTEQLSQLVGVKPKSVSIKNYKSRWGSCSSRGSIDFNWRIIMAPKFVIDYVVIHELSHLLEHNHSPRYWRIVENNFPKWRESRDWLKANSGNLMI